MSKWWPDFESEIQKIEQQLSLDVVEEPVRSDRELLEDILDTVRSVARNSGDVFIEARLSEPMKEEELRYNETTKKFEKTRPSSMSAKEEVALERLLALLKSQKVYSGQTPAHDIWLDE